MNANKNKDSDDDNADYFNPEEEVGISSNAKTDLPQVELKTGEEEEDLIFTIRARLYRWRNKEWKERGTGEIKLLRHKTNKRIRCILRQDKTLKAVANFLIGDDPLCILKEHQGSDKMFFFTAYDCSEDDPLIEKFVLKFDASKFKKAFEDAKAFNKAVKSGGELVYAEVIEDDKKDEEEKEKAPESKEPAPKEEK